MALSTNTYTYAGGAQTFAVNFALGFIQRSDVAVRINLEVDGSGDPVYTSFTWIDDSAISVTPTLTIGDNVLIERTVSKTELKVNFSNNTDVTPANLDLSAKHGLMVYQELIDGRVDGTESPIVAANRAEAAALAAEADLVLTNADVVSTNADVVSTNANVVTAAALLTYNEGSVGAINRTLTSKLQEHVSVKDFGAVGDGTTDDTVAIQAALDSGAGAHAVYLPAGTYSVSATIFIPSDTNLYGDGKNSVIKMVGTEGRNTTVVMTGFRNNKRENIVIEDLMIDFNRDRWTVSGGTQLTDAFNGTAGYNTYQDNDESALVICYSENVLVKNVRAIDGYKHCIDIQAPAYREGTDGATYDSQPSKNVTLENCYTSGAGDDNITTHHSTDITISGCWSEYPSGQRVPQNSNCYEIDDGSRNVLMTDNVAVGGIYGLQIKGHDYGPAPYNVTVDGFRTTNATQGVEIRHQGWYSNKTAYDGTGAQVAFTLPTGYDVNTVVYVGGVLQVYTTDYTISGTTLTFVSAPVAGTDNIEVYKSDDGDLPELVDDEGNAIAYTGTSPTARNVQLSNIAIVAPREVTQPNGTTYPAKYGMRIRSYENVQITNISFNDSTLDLGGDYSASTALSGNAVFRIYYGAKNVTIKNASIYGFSNVERGLYTTGSLIGPIIVDGFTSSGGPQYPIRCSPSEGLYEGLITNYMIDGNQPSGAGVYISCPYVQVGQGFVSSGYEHPLQGVNGSTENAQPAPLTHVRRARSGGGTATTPVAVQQFNWREESQDLGAGEGLKLSWGMELQADSSPSEFGFVGFQKAASGDADRLQNFVIGQSADGGVTAPTAVFEVAADGTVRPSVDNTQNLGDASHRWSEVFADTVTATTVDFTAPNGTWTPVISDSTTGGNVATATVTDAVYRNIGGMIYAKCKLKNIGTAGMTGGSNIYIQGLPIAAESDSEGVISHAYFTPDAAGIGLVPSVDEGTTYIKLKELRTGTTFVNANVDQFTSGTADMWISIVYPS